MPSVLEMRGVTAGYGEHTVLHGLSARIPRGRITAVLGPGASGKSTLLRVLEGRAAPPAWWTGEVPTLDAWRMPQPRRGVDELGDLGLAEMVIQRWAFRAGVDYTIVRHELLLDPAVLARVSRIVTATAPVLLLDEPDAWVHDRDLSVLILALRDLSMQGRTIVMVTHDLSLARRVADHVLLLVDGHKLDEGPPRRVQTQPSCDRARDFFTWGG